MEKEEQVQDFSAATTPGWECKRQVLKFARKTTLCRDAASAACGYCPNHCQKERCEAHGGIGRR